MFNFDSTTMNNTSLFEQSISVNQNRIGNHFLFGNTTTSNLFGTSTIYQPSSLETKYESVGRLDKVNKNDIQTSNHTKISNELYSKEYKDKQNFSSSSTIITTTTTTTSPTLNTFLFDNKSLMTTNMTFSFESSQPSTSTFTLGNSSSFFPTTTNTPFTFSLSKPTTTLTNTTAPILFSTMNPSKTSPVHLQLFQTMLNTQPFNNELAFLSQNIKPNVSLDRARFRLESDSSTNHPKNNLFSSVLTKPSILSSTSTSLINPLPTHPNTFPYTLSSSTSNKRKLIDDDDDDPCSINKISKINIKRPRMLDMNKIRSIVLGNNETYMVKSSPLPPPTIENLLEWKKYSTYDEYISSKKQEIKHEQRSFRLPKLTHKDYYTKPTIEELRSYFNEQGQCFVKQFTVGRKHYGSVTFQGLHMNLSGLDLDQLVEIDHRQVTVYPNDKDRPIEGEELNCQAIISLLGVYPIDRSISNSGEEVTDPDRLIEMNYGKYLEKMTNKFHGQFIDYDVYTGTWTFKVEHF